MSDYPERLRLEAHELEGHYFIVSPRAEGIEYVRADIHDAALARAEAAEARIAKAMEIHESSYGGLWGEGQDFMRDKFRAELESK